jgi:hypothetical protein
MAIAIKICQTQAQLTAITNQMTQKKIFESVASQRFQKSSFGFKRKAL